MDYQGYTNFSEFVFDKTDNLVNLGFIDFIGRHTFWIAFGLVILFILYKIFVEPLFKEKEEEELHHRNNSA